MDADAADDPTAALTPTQSRVAREIVALVRREGRRAGAPLREAALARGIGTSRSPVLAALRHLAARGLVRQDPNRGFSVAVDAPAWEDLAEQIATRPDDPLYLRIAEDRRVGALPDEVGEADLMRRYGVARGTLRKVFARLSEEGWAEQRVGHGWTFLPMIDSAQAYEESYRFREAIEPTGVTGPFFAIEPAQFDGLRAEQARIVEHGHATMTAIELFEANSRFHETLAGWSNNRFILQGVRRVNLQRRLVEYCQAADRDARRAQSREHLAILDALAQPDRSRAAELLRAHLAGARERKLRGPGADFRAAAGPSVSAL